MTHRTEWTVEPREPGWLGRVIAPHGGGRPSSLTLGLGALAAAAFGASLALDWQKVTIAPPQGGDGPQNAPMVLTTGLGAIETLSLVYVLGTIALLALVGGVATRPELALRLRMATLGAGFGVLAVLIAVTLRMPRTFFGAQGLFEALYGGFSSQLQDRAESSYEPGIFFGYAAVILPLIAVWLAGRPADRPEATDDAMDQEELPESAAAPTTNRRTARMDGPLDLSVTSDGPVDLTVRSDHGWPR